MIFASLTRSDVAYAVEKAESFRDNGYYKWPSHYLQSEIVEFPTYDDGLTQHGCCSSVAVENFVDCLASMARYLFHHPEDMEQVENIWPNRDYKKDIAFAASIKYDAEKTRYYSMQEMKVSASDKKRHDRRYEMVPEWADGSLQSIFRLLTLDWSYQGVITRFDLYRQIKDYVLDLNGWFGPGIDGHGIGSSEDMYSLNDSFSAVRLQVEAYRKMYHAKRVYECLMNNRLNARGNKEGSEAIEEKEDLVEVSVGKEYALMEEMEEGENLEQ